MVLGSVVLVTVYRPSTTTEAIPSSCMRCGVRGWPRPAVGVGVARQINEANKRDRSNTVRHGICAFPEEGEMDGNGAGALVVDWA